MTDETITADPNVQQQVSSGNSQGTQPPPNEDWKKRFDGAVRKIEELTLQNRELNTTIQSLQAEKAQLETRIGNAETDKTIAVRERDTQLSTALEQNRTINAELETLRGLKRKIDMAKKLNAPHLLRIIDSIPNLGDDETLEGVMKDFMGFADEAVRAREQQLLAGQTMPVGPGGGAPSEPQSEQAWQEKIESFGLGTTERAKMLDKYGDWLQRKHSTR